MLGFGHTYSKYFTMVSVGVKWNTKNLEVTTLSVEKALAPLVKYVTTLVNINSNTKKRKGKSNNAKVLVATMEKAVQHFIQTGEQIANENGEIKKEMFDAVELVRSKGNNFKFLRYVN